MEEFKEGNLLFEIMERKVWSTAISDSNGLKKYYNEHKNKYLWNESADVIVFSCSNKATADESHAALSQGKDSKKLQKKVIILCRAIRADTNFRKLL